jgi:hypothetical protein
MTDLELLRIEVVVRRAVTAVLEREMPIAMAVRAAAVSLLQGDPNPAASLPQERPSERCARRNREALARMAELEAAGRGRVPRIVARGDRFLDHHTHYTTAATRRTALIYTMIVLAFGALCGLGGWVLRYRLEPPAPVAAVNCVAVPQQRGEQGHACTFSVKPPQ